MFLSQNLFENIYGFFILYMLSFILGALGLGDIGHHFPDNNAAFKDIDISQSFETAIWGVVTNVIKDL